MTIVVLPLVAVTGLMLFAVTELHGTASPAGSSAGLVRAEAPAQIAQQAHIAELVKEHRRAVLDNPTLLR